MCESAGIAVLFRLVGILMSAVGYKACDLIETRIDLADGIKEGHITAAIMVAGFLIGICLIIGRTVGS